MTIYEQIERLDALIDYIENELPIFAEQVLANDLVALVTNRVVQKGENFQGNSFKPYSFKTVAAWRFWGKSRTQKAERKIRALSRAGQTLDYVTFRELNNLNTDKKNFEFTGEMWRKFGVIKTEIELNNFLVTIGGKTQAAQNKIDTNSDNEGLSIIEANSAEKLLVQKTTSVWIEDQAKRILNE